MTSNLGEVFSGGATTSQHVDADDDDHFHNTTFKLKRTRSLGLLDEFIDSEQQKKHIENQNEEREAKKHELQNSIRISTQNLSQNSTQNSTQNSNQQSNDSNISGTQGIEALDFEESESDQQSPVVTSHSAYLASPDIVPHDDSDMVAEPSRHVDYLSHHWDVSDISKSWRYVISRRKNVANAARLENASWRTWAQRRSNLKTISPERVNWSKESDVTWLYGPIVDDDDHDHENEAAPEDSRSFNTASSVVAGDISIARKTHRPKPILKKRTVEDMMISHSNLLKLEIATARAEQEQTRREDAAAQERKDAMVKSGSERPPEYFDYDVISAKLNSQYKNVSASNSANNSSANLVGKFKSLLNDLTDSTTTQNEASEERSQSEVPSILAHSNLQRKDSARSTEKIERHIHFNDEVQQCIAIHDSDLGHDDFEDYDDDENDYDYEAEDNYLYESYSSNLDHPDPYNNEDEDGDDNDDDDDDDDDDEGGFFLNVRSLSTAQMPGTLPGISSQSRTAPSKEEAQEQLSDTASSTNSNLNSIKTIHLLPPTTLNYGSDEEDSDDSNPYTSSISHNIDSNSSRGYDYFYDYNTVYQIDPKHAIYGEGSKNKSPDVVDVPKNITVGSNFDYEIIENEDIDGTRVASPEIMGHVGQPPPAATAENKERLPISSLDDSAARSQNLFSFQDEDTEDSSDSDNDMGLSISARNSSQSLAQSVFGQQMTSMTNEEQHYPHQEPEPESKHISFINPNYSSASLSRQPHSSNSLSGQFFGEGMTKAVDDDSLSRSFFNNVTEISSAQGSQSQPFTGTSSPPVSKKTTALPPHTTSAYAFSGSQKAPLPKKNAFNFDSDSDSDDEMDTQYLSATIPEGEDTRSKYSSLYEVAGRNGITVPNTDADDNKAKKGSAMSNFLGSWNKGNSG